MMKPALALFLVLLSGCDAPANPKISVRDGWAPEAAQDGVAAAYVTIENKGGADLLTGVRTGIGEASLHETSMDGGIARMRPIHPSEGMVVPSNGKLVLTQGGAHVMISNLTRPLRAGDEFNLTLLFDKARPQKVQVTVRPIGAAH
ncbi:MAG TPA: copper chaperone PCu(A)C [Sphingomicrobium sp.]|nr:copper chaperone PCu(A)C [Sphingomicrobium sp.]